MPRILVTDDDAIVRKGLKRFLEEESGLRVKVDTSDGQDVWAKIKQQLPDLVIMDPMLSAADGFAILEQLGRHQPAIPVLVYTHDATGDLGLIVVRIGAAGYLTKDRPWEEMVAGVQKLLTGRKFIAESLVERLAAEARCPSAASVLAKLPRREAQILNLLVAGHSIKEIAAKLSLGPTTVSTYRSRILIKFGFENNAQLVRFATENRWFLARRFASA